MPIPITGITSLVLEYNNLSQLPNSTLYGYSNLRELRLENNNLAIINVEELPPNLTHLDLRSNKLTFLDSKVTEFLSRRAGKIDILLSENPWICNCDAVNMFEFVADLSNNVIDRDGLMCNEKHFILTMHRLKLDVCKSNLMYNTLGTLLGLSVLLIIFLYAKKSIYMWLYERNLCLECISSPEPKADTALKIDAFLAFSHVDLDLIYEYLDKLETGPREYKLRFYQRDWKIGESIPDCILESIEYSKRVIILLTNNFVHSSWGLFEFRSAIKATSMDPNKRLIVILYPDVDLDKLEPELKRYMTYNTYLRRDDPQFWRKLMFAMPHKKIHCEQPGVTDCPAIEDCPL